MPTRMSTLFLRTLREDPADAEVPSHRLLVRAGYVRRVAPGDLHLAAAGLPGAAQRRADRARGDGRGRRPGGPLPGAAAARAVRARPAGGPSTAPNLFRLADRRGADYLLGPTHEEMFTLLVKDLYSSYKDLPVCLYQIQTKYRDEARPRAGILRGREFLMKDSYSFDLRRRRASRRRYARAPRGVHQRSSTGSASSYTIVAGDVRGDGRLGLGGVPGRGAGGRGHLRRLHGVRLRGQHRGGPSHAPAAGAARRRCPAAHVDDTPDTPTIADARRPGQRAARPARDRPWTAADTLKNVVLKVHRPDGSSEPLAIGVPGRPRGRPQAGSRPRSRPATAPLFDEADFARHARPGPRLHRPAGAGRGRPRASGTWPIRGWPPAPRGSPGRTSPAGTPSTWSPAATSPPTALIEAAEVRDGRPLPGVRPAHGSLTQARGIEIGHIFQLGRNYADAFGLTLLGEHGKPVGVTMGSYGIGVSRAVAAVAEQHHDERGLVWPREVAPCDVHVVATGKARPCSRRRWSWPGLDARGLRVLVDDRTGVSPG